MISPNHKIYKTKDNTQHAICLYFENVIYENITISKKTEEFLIDVTSNVVKVFHNNSKDLSWKKEYKKWVVNYVEQKSHIQKNHFYLIDFEMFTDLLNFEYHFRFRYEK